MMVAHNQRDNYKCIRYTTTTGLGLALLVSTLCLCDRSTGQSLCKHEGLLRLPLYAEGLCLGDRSTGQGLYKHEDLPLYVEGLCFLGSRRRAWAAPRES